MEGLIDKYKARLVVRGFTQTQGIDYKKTFLPILRYKSLRLLLAIAVIHGFKLWLLNIVTVYLNGEIDAEIYILLPEELIRTRQNNGKVLKLLKGLYRLKQSGRIWNFKFREVIEAAGFKAISTNPYIFKKVYKEGVYLLALYIDIIVIAAKVDSVYRTTKKVITNTFKVTDSGLLIAILGIRIT